MATIFFRVLGGYGSFLALPSRISQALLLFSSLLNPLVGAVGMLGGCLVILCRKILGFQSEGETVDIINGLLLGMLLGSTFAFSPTMLALLMFGSLLVVLMSACLRDTLTLKLKLPLLGLPYVISAFIVWPLAFSLRLPPAVPPFIIPNWQFLPSSCDVLSPLGAMYFSGTQAGGVIALAALVIASRYLALLALGSAILSALVMDLIGIPRGSLSFLVFQMNGVLSACIIGAIYAVPGRRSIAVACLSSLLSVALCVSLERLMYSSGLPILALPFVLSTYAILVSLGPQRGGQWLNFWLPAPSLPETANERISISESRGIDYRSIALKPPFSGTWEVSQGIDGPFTHQGLWRYALDFIQTVEGISFKNDGTTASDYHCFGKPVLSPVYGTIIDYRTDLPDNRPGEVDTQNNWGNYVLIQLDAGPVVLLAHLNKDSVRVSLYQRVVPGQLLALCGNSGRSTQPHLHMHVQESRVLGSRTLPFHLAGITISEPESEKFSLNSRPSEGNVLTAPSKNIALRRSLHLTVGNRLMYMITDEAGRANVSTVEVRLDLSGQFYLAIDDEDERSHGSKVGFTVTDDLLALYDRSGSKNTLLDALILSTGLSPLVDVPSSHVLEWRDKVPKRILPLSPFEKILTALLSPLTVCIDSRYERRWESSSRLWMQTGTHELVMLGGLFKRIWITEARLCELQGLINLRVEHTGTNRRQVWQANLIGYGLREDSGIPQRDPRFANACATTDSK